ncbi:hypothetical protein ScPMuIL_012893 [Solemya velum]
MNFSCIWWLTFTSFLYLSFTVYTVSGKCSGRWAIHSCYGGNGKRSGFDNPSLNTDTDNQKQLLLKRLLLRDVPDTDRDWEESLGEDFEREEVDDLSQPDIRQLTDLVRELLMQKKFRNGMDRQQLA